MDRKNLQYRQKQQLSSNSSEAPKEPKSAIIFYIKAAPYFNTQDNIRTALPSKALSIATMEKLWDDFEQWQAEKRVYDTDIAQYSSDCDKQYRTAQGILSWLGLNYTGFCKVYTSSIQDAFKRNGFAHFVPHFSMSPRMPTTNEIETEINLQLSLARTNPLRTPFGGGSDISLFSEEVILGLFGVSATPQRMGAFTSESEFYTGLLTEDSFNTFLTNNIWGNGDLNGRSNTHNIPLQEIYADICRVAGQPFVTRPRPQLPHTPRVPTLCIERRTRKLRHLHTLIHTSFNHGTCRAQIKTLAHKYYKYYRHNDVIKPTDIIISFI